MRLHFSAAAAFTLCTFGAINLASAQDRINPAAAAELRAQGLAQGYNLDHAEALATFQRAIDLDPASPSGYRLLGAAAWTMLLFEQGAIAVDDFLGEARKDYQRTPPRADLARLARTSLDRAVELTDLESRDGSQVGAVRYQAGAGHGLRAAYTATVEGRLFASLGDARRAYREHDRVIALDPSRKDAGLIVGMYRYTVASLSAPLRLGAFLAGIRGGRQQGLRLVEDAASYPSDVQTNARFSLVLMYNREARYGDALRVIKMLQQQFPRNRLLWIEEAGTALRAGLAEEARAASEIGLTRLSSDPRPRAPGEESRWHYTHAAALVALRRTAPALAELRTALAGATRDWVRGRIHLEMGKAADLVADRGRALDEYRQASQLCRLDSDPVCVDESRVLLKRSYR